MSAGLFFLLTFMPCISSRKIDETCPPGICNKLIHWT